MFNLESEIADWRRQLAAGGVKALEVLDELESHLREDLEQQVRSGLSPQQAFAAAVQRIGQAEVLKTEFDKAGASKDARMQKCFWRVFGVSAGAFLVGVGFAYLVILPQTLRSSAAYTAWLGLTPLAATASLSFMFRLVVAWGLAVAVLACLLSLVRLGKLDHRKLSRLRRYVIVLNLILAVLLTTPEVVTQVLMFIPLQLLYEACVGFAWFRERNRPRPA